MRPLSKGLVLLLLALVIIRAPQAMEEVHSSVSQGDARLAAFKNNLMEIALARGAVVKGLSLTLMIRVRCMRIRYLR